MDAILRIVWSAQPLHYKYRAMSHHRASLPVHEKEGEHTHVVMISATAGLRLWDMGQEL